MAIGDGGVPVGSSPREPLLAVEGLKLRYRSGAIGVHDVSLRVYPSQVVALFGPNGAGKTTTVRSVSGFMKREGARVAAGRVTFGGRDITGFEPHRTCALGVAIVPERRKIFRNLSVRENLAALGKRAPRGSERKARYAEIYELFPVLADRGHELAGRLSGGQQQMLAIARALISNPRLLMIDEMTLGLHQSLHGQLFSAIGKIAREGRAVLVVDESTAMAMDVADYCYLIRDGYVRDQGEKAKFVGDELSIAGYVER